MTAPANQIWTKTDTNSGYATCSQGTGCLTCCGLQGFPVITVESARPVLPKQQWRNGVSGDLQLRLNGLVAEANTASEALRPADGLLPGLGPNQKWTIPWAPNHAVARACEGRARDRNPQRSRPALQITSAPPRVSRQPASVRMASKPME